MADQNQTIIIKKIKKSGGGHHGGAWKVAYADFVTAMMAFFLLMWLLNATEAENLAGLADYFAPTVGIKDEMGIGFRGGKSALSEGIGADRNTNKGIVFGGVPAGPITKVTKKIEERTDEVDQEQIKIIIDKTESEEKTKKKDTGASSSPGGEDDSEFSNTQKALDTVAEDLVKEKRWEDGSIEIRRVPEGLAIEIKDVSGNSMFKEHSAEMLQPMKEALIELSKVLRNIPNNLAVIGHTSSVPVQGKGSGFTKWELSSERANSTRQFLEKNGVQGEQFSRMEGRADNTPYDRRRPENPVNNRINIILLKKNDTPSHKKSSPDSLFLNLKSDETQQFIENAEEKEVEVEKIKIEKSEEMQKIIDQTIGIPDAPKEKKK